MLLNNYFSLILTEKQLWKGCTMYIGRGNLNYFHPTLNVRSLSQLHSIFWIELNWIESKLVGLKPQSIHKTEFLFVSIAVSHRKLHFYSRHKILSFCLNFQVIQNSILIPERSDGLTSVDLSSWIRLLMLLSDEITSASLSFVRTTSSLAASSSRRDVFIRLWATLKYSGDNPSRCNTRSSRPFSRA